QAAGHARLDRPIQLAVTAKEVVLAVGDGGVVRVGARAEAELVGIEPLGVLRGEAVLWGRPRGFPRRTDMISKLENSSLGDSRGCVSEVPFSCLISISGSLRSRDAA